MCDIHDADTAAQLVRDSGLRGVRGPACFYDDADSFTVLPFERLAAEIREISSIRARLRCTLKP